MIDNANLRKNSETFRFTSVWRELITLLHDQVRLKRKILKSQSILSFGLRYFIETLLIYVIKVILKRRRYLTRTTCAVFSGANAVDVLYRHIQKNPGLFPDTEIFERAKAMRLCQRFLDLRVFFPAKEKSQNGKIGFEDSHFVFYRFNPANDYIGMYKVLDAELYILL